MQQVHLNKMDEVDERRKGSEDTLLLTPWQQASLVIIVVVFVALTDAFWITRAYHRAVWTRARI